MELDIFRFWGKARPLHPDSGPQWHPLVLHCLDVAAVGDALLAQHSGLAGRLCGLLGLARDEATPVILHLLALHDIGKFARRFQAKAPDLYPGCFADDPHGISVRYDHGAGGLRLFDCDDGFFRLPKTVRRRAWRPLVSAVAGHHGSPPSADTFHSTRAGLRPDFGKRGMDAASEFVGLAHKLFSPSPELPPIDPGCAHRASFALAGLAVVADWIGSNQKWFPYCDPADDGDIDAYWRRARQQAEHAVAEAGILPAGSGGRLGYDSLIEKGATPSPMQEWARSVELPDGPALFVIEDETGSGKTEAALMLAHRLMAAGRADGLYIALPTMATANAMFARLGKAHRELFAADSTPSIALAHGARDMHEGFRSAVLRGGRAEAGYSGAGGGFDDADTTASAACAAWIADDRRRAFLADAGAGTVDQALLAVLPNRHQSLRLLGLMHRVLILDEVHAYDAYMQREIEALLEFQAGLGGSAILLSATLPATIRRRLLDAFRVGPGLPAASEAVEGGTEYPLAGVRAAGCRRTTAVRARPGRSRALPVRFLRAPGEALDEVESAARAGKAVVYIRNAVDDAIEAYEALTARGLDARLFHARFALADRLKIEKQVAATFGKASEARERAGKVLVATQVVEQSLDLDFDAMATDLAPVDLTIQRAGRLWRHCRPERRGQPELLVVAPEPVRDAGESWFKSVFPRAAWVYPDHARLWLTARTLEDKGEIESPGGLRALVEAVYGDDADARVPEGLKERYFDADGRAGADRGIANTNTLKLASGYVYDGGAWDRDVRTPTRLDAGPATTLRLARIRSGRVVPWAEDADSGLPWRAWRLSEVSARIRGPLSEVIPPEHADAARAAKADWPRLDNDKILILLDDTGCGAAMASENSDAPGQIERPLRYSCATGLQWLSVGAI